MNHSNDVTLTLLINLPFDLNYTVLRMRTPSNNWVDFTGDKFWFSQVGHGAKKLENFKYFFKNKTVSSSPFATPQGGLFPFSPIFWWGAKNFPMVHVHSYIHQLTSLGWFKHIDNWHHLSIQKKKYILAVKSWIV